jgi:CBS domain-containing protein
VADAGPGELSLFHYRVRDLVRRAPVTCPVELGALELARLMSREQVGSVVIVDADGAAIGIVTDRDLRQKVVAEGRDPVTTRARDIMSEPLVTIRPGAFAFEALLEMTRRDLHHLVVTDDRALAGVVSSHDFLLLQTTHPVTLAREITRAGSLPALAELAVRITTLVRRLLDEGGSAHDIGQIVSELNDRMVIRVLGLAASALEEAGAVAPPVSYCWLLFGSEARREQTLRTDQDNGLVYAEPPPELAATAAEYYGRFAAEAIRGLVQIGFPPCPGGVMASNPRWCQPAPVWADYFRRWIHDATPQQVLEACIHFDLRPLVGAGELAERLLDLVRREAPAQRRFLSLLARDVVDRRVPLTLLGHVGVHRSGPHKDTVDIKGAGAIQLVGAARLFTLEAGRGETNTLDRLRAAGARGLYPDEVTREITDAYQLLVRIRLVHQLRQAAAGQPVDNHVNPAELSHAEAVLLRDALKTVARVQADVRERFATDFVPG